MKIDPIEKRNLLEAIDLVRSFIEQQETTKGCISCVNWKDGCKLAQGQTPPSDIIKNGCPAWEIWDIIPY